MSGLCPSSGHGPNLTATLGGGTLTVTLSGAGISLSWIFSGNVFGGGSSGDCTAISGVSLSLVGPNPFTYAICDLTAVTCSVSAA